MSTTLIWHGDKFTQALEAQTSRAIRAACIALTRWIKEDISQSGVLSYTGTTKAGKPSKQQKRRYNFTHSRPGNPPYKQTGHLRRSVTYEVIGQIGRVGSNLKYARYLELGTRKMAARPFIRKNFNQHLREITSIIQGTIKAGMLEFGRNNFRSGHLGSGAAGTGYDEL